MDRVLRWLRGALGLSALLGAGATAVMLLVVVVASVIFGDAPSAGEIWTLLWVPASIGAVAGLVYSAAITITSGRESVSLGPVWSVIGGFLAGLVAPWVMLVLADPSTWQGDPTWLDSFFDLLPSLLPFGIGGAAVGGAIAFIARSGEAELEAGESSGMLLPSPSLPENSTWVHKARSAVVPDAGDRQAWITPPSN